MVAFATFAGLAVAPLWGKDAVDLLFHPAVLGAALRSGLRPALFSALTSALAYDYFFTLPHGSLRISSPTDLVTVSVLFLVAAVASQLAASARKHSLIASAHAARNATIAGLARRLLSCRDEEEIAFAASEQLAALFGCNVLLTKAGPNPILLSSAPAPIALGTTDLAAATLAFETGSPSGRATAHASIAEWQFHPVRSDASVIGALGLAREDGAPPVRAEQLALLQNLIDQVALAMDRARIEAEAREFAASHARDHLRSALLSTIARDLMPSADAIQDRVDRLRRESPDGKESIGELRSETTRLQRYIANLGDLGLDADPKPIEAQGVSIDLFHRKVLREGREVHLPPKEYAVLAELAKHPGRVLSHTHLLRTVWGPAQEGQMDYLRVAVRGLRQKLEPVPSRPRLIINEPAVGYRLLAE